MNSFSYRFRHWLKTNLLLLAATWVASCGGSSNPELLERAMLAERDGDFRTASIHLRNLVKADPDNAQAAVRLGHVSLALGNAHGAESMFRRARSLGAIEQDVRLPLLHAMFARGDYQRVIDITDEDDGQTREERIGLLLMIGSAYQALGYAAEAEVRFRNTLELKPDSIDALLSLTQLMVSASRFDDARALVTRMLDLDADFVPALMLQGGEQERQTRFSDAQATYERVLALLGDRRDGQYVLATLRLAEAQLGQNRVADAKRTAARLVETQPQALQPRFLQARIAAQMQEYDRARATLHAILRDAPEFHPAQRLLGTIYAVQGDLRQAALYLKLAMWADPDDEFVRQLLAKVRLRQHRPGDALELVRPVASKSNGDALFLALAGEASLQAGDRDGALRYFKRRLERDPNDLQAHLSVVSTHLAAGETDRAIEMLEALQGDGSRPVAADYLLTLAHLRKGDLETAIRLATSLADTHPEMPWASNLLGSVHLVADNKVAARLAFYRAIDLDPDNVAAISNLAKLEIRLGKPAKAVAHLEEIVNIDPANARAMIMLAQLELARGDRDAAVDWLGNAAQASDDSVVAHKLLARLLLSEGNTDAALQLAQKTVKESPEAPDAHALLGTVSMAMSNTAKALVSFRRAVELAPNESRYLVKLAGGQYASGNAEGAMRSIARARQFGPLTDNARFILGMSQHAVGDTREAAKTFELTVALNPRSVAALNNLAWLYHELGDPRAISTAKRAYDVAPEHGAVTDTLGWLYTESGDHARGLELLTRALEQSPKSAEIRYHLAVAHARHGDEDAARTLLSEALRSDNVFRSRQAATILLAELGTLTALKN